MAPDIPVRLGKLLRERTGLPLTKLEGLLTCGRIEIGGQVALGLKRLVFAGDEVKLDGAELPAPRSPEYYILNKPRGVTTTTASPDRTPDLSPWLDALPRGVFPVGRLDRDSSGLLILTSDGDLAFALLSPRHHVSKTYRVTLRATRPITETQLHRLLGPLTVGGQVLSAVSVTLVAEGDAKAHLLIVLEEGRSHQIRKMCFAIGLRVLDLERISIGELSLANLPVGVFRPLDGHEVERLWHSVGGKQTVRKRQVEALIALAQRSRADGAPDARLEQWLRDNLPPG